ncbi:hypothetical protein C1645_837135 [Glomus cerebriforme]|uniref:CCHC-type domain-containing protein n=1 Tax=Glomus cerebriforme TaxID=658196 RepID=A0A397SAN3_9GLOM|nr:hypothetical protein C1645_837135 [Glomus cerebriforme]
MRNNNGNDVNWNKVTYFKCGKKRHTSKICRENQRGMNRRNNQVNYLNEEYYDKEYDVYNIKQNKYDEYDEYEYDEYKTYKIENEDYIEENNMYPVPTRRTQTRRKGFTPKQLQKAKEIRRRNNLCQNCGQSGHFHKECTNEKVRINRRVPNTEKFDPVKEIMNAPVPMTWGQYIREKPNVARKLRNGEIKNINQERRTQATRCNVIVKGKMIRALVDTGAGPSAISNILRKELNIPIIKKSNIVLTIADGKSIASLGIAEIEIKINEDLGIMLEVEVIDSKWKDLILGTDLLKHGIIDMREGMLTIKLDNETYEIPIDYKGRKGVTFEESESETESDTDIEKGNDNISNSSDESEYEYENTEKEEIFFLCGKY